MMCKIDPRNIRNFFSSIDPEGHVIFCYHSASWSPFRIVSDNPVTKKDSHLHWRTFGNKINKKSSNCWVNGNQTLMKWSLIGPLSEACPVTTTSIQDSHHKWTWFLKWDPMGNFFYSLLEMVSKFKANIPLMQTGWWTSKIVSGSIQTIKS